jgi:hypothetical protein
VALGGKSHKKRALNSIGQPHQKGSPLTELNKTARPIYHWMFSWAQSSYCNMMEEEYFVSLFIASRQAMEIMGCGVVEAIIKFTRKNAFPHEERME